MLNILTINTGSGTIKFSLYQEANHELVAIYQVVADKFANPCQLIIEKVSGNHRKIINLPEKITDENFYSSAITVLLDWLESQAISISAVSHRVVHGGIYYYAPIIITDEIIKTLETLIPLAPLHQPFNLRGILQAQARLPNCPHIACFDTAFHHTNPSINRYYAIPREWEAQGVRRYGFHGLSYAYIQQQLEKIAPDIAKQKIIIAHLGQGASLCALHEGKSVLTSMGFTALDGLVMGTRSGSLDPGVLLYWLNEKKLTTETITNILYKQSGLLGLSGISSDMRVLLESTEAEAQLAINIFVKRVCHYIGMLAAELQGLHALVFTAGIGEHSAIIRSKICANFQWLGMQIDEDANQTTQFQISTKNSAIKVLMIPTNEEYMLAQYAKDLLMEISY